MSLCAMAESEGISVWSLSVGDVIITKLVLTSTLADTMREVTTCMHGLQRSTGQLLLKVHFFTLTLSTRRHFSL